MDLPKLVDKMKKAFLDAEEIWKSIGLPVNDQEQRRQSILATIERECNEFFQAQKTYQ